LRSSPRTRRPWTRHAFDTPATTEELKAAGDAATPAGGVATCPHGYVVERSKLIQSTVVGKNGLGLCPTHKQARNTIVVKE